jgi:hypothetical protein
MPNSEPADLERVAAAVAALRAFWETGRSSWGSVQQTAEGASGGGRKKTRRKQKPAGYVHGNKTEVLRRAAAHEGMNHDTLQKAWRAARLYTREQIEELCGLIDRHAARFGPTHLSRVMAIKDARKRDALTRRAIRGRWGVTRLERAVQLVNGRREHVGKRPQVPEGRSELLTSLLALCEKWRRFGTAAGPSLPAHLDGAVGRATKAVERVRAIATAELASTTTGTEAARK